MLEILICAVSTALTAATATAQAAPPAELLEFIGDWRDDEAHLFLDARKPRQQKPLPSLDGASHQPRDAADEKK